MEPELYPVEAFYSLHFMVPIGLMLVALVLILIGKSKLLKIEASLLTASLLILATSLIFFDYDNPIIGSLLALLSLILFGLALICD